jgi:glycosyltransferase involved in cell wall biosynthesis
VIPAVAARYGGPSETALKLCRALAERGIEVTLLSTDADGPGRLNVPRDVMTEYAGVRSIFCSRTWSEGVKYSPALARWLARHAGEFDVLHVHAVFSHSSLAAARQCWKRDIPYVLRPLGSLASWALARKRWRKRVLMQAVGLRMVRRAAAVHYTTRGERELSERAVGPTRGVVIPPGVDQDLLQASVPPPESRAPVILALGRLHPVKNLESAIEAFHRLAPVTERAQWRLVIAGDGDAAYRRHVNRLAAGGAARGRIDLLGWLDDTQKRAWLYRAALLVQLSHQENFGLAMVEGLAAGVPALAADGVSLAVEVVEAGAGWRTTGTPADVEAVLRNVLADRRALADRARAARTLAQHFTWPSAAAAVEDLYRRVVAERAAPPLTADETARSPVTGRVI